MMQFKSIIWILPFSFFIVGYVTTRLLLNQNTISMPLLLGKTTDSALIMLSHTNLNPRVIGVIEDPDSKPGTIVTQIPRAESKVRPAQTVFLVITARPDTPIIDQFIGKSKEYIEKTCAIQKTKVTIIKYPYPLPENTCFAQYPSAGNSLNQPLIIYVAQEIEHKYIVPSLRKKPAVPVLEHLKKQGVEVIIIGEYADTTITEKYNKLDVIDQRPLPGSFITGTSMHKPSLHIRLGKQS